MSLKLKKKKVIHLEDFYQQILIYRNRGTYEIHTYEKGEARGRNDNDAGFFIQDHNMVRYD